MTAIVLAAAMQSGSMSEDEKIRHLLDRFTPGATTTLVEEVRARGRRAWFEDQLRGDLPESGELKRRTAKLETLDLPTSEILARYDRKEGPNATPQEKKEVRRLGALPAGELFQWIVWRSVYGGRHVREAACDFFRNHFSVSVDKDLRFLLTAWERDVILAKPLGRFGDLLEATARHPAMLVFLDNHLSRRPPTEAELREIEQRVRRQSGSEERAEEAVSIARQRGLNENYARELLELHTLGVDNLYTQQDVIEVAMCLTGWTQRRRDGSFLFEARMHCPGDKTFLGQTIREDRSGPGEGRQVLDILKRHPATAKFLSWKLCRWFVNDRPDPEMVGRIAEVFLQTDGDLARTLLALVEDPAFYARENLRAKFKRPWEFVVSALRATQADVTGPAGVNQALTAMNEPLYRCADPTGYYDQAEAWCDPGAMAARWAFASDLVAGRIAGVRVPDSLYADLPVDRPSEWREILARKILPAVGIGRETSAHIDRLVAKKPKGRPSEVGPLIVAALLGAPEFQRQ